MANSTKSWHITIPAMPLPFISAPAPMELDIPIESMKTGLRIVVIISTYLLFRPQLEKLFRRLTGKLEPTAAEVQERMKFIEQERGAPIGGGKKVVAMATPGGTKTTSTGSSAAAATPGSAKPRRKA